MVTVDVKNARNKKKEHKKLRGERWGQPIVSRLKFGLPKPSIVPTSTTRRLVGWVRQNPSVAENRSMAMSGNTLGDVDEDDDEPFGRKPDGCFG